MKNSPSATRERERIAHETSDQFMRELIATMGVLDFEPPAPHGTAMAQPGTTVLSQTKLSAYVHKLDLNAPIPRGHDFLVGAGGSGLFPMGSLSVMASPGGMMKTSLALAIGVNVAAGSMWAGLATRESAVLFAAMEDDYAEVMRRTIATTLTQIDKAQHPKVELRMRFATLSGIDARLTANVFGNSQRTNAVEQFIEEAKLLAHSSGVPVGLIVFDHARLVIGGDLNDSGAVTELTRALAHIAKETGAAVLLLCHSPKSTVNPKHSGDYTAADVLGSGASVDNSRCACVVTTLTEAERKTHGLTPDASKPYVALRVIKSNYSETGRVIYFRKTPVDGWGVVVPDVVTLARPAREYIPPPSNADKVLAFLRSNPRRFTRTSFKVQAGLDGPMGIGTASVAAALDSLIKVGRVVLLPPTPDEIVAHGLGRQAKEVLHVREQ